MLKLKRQFAKEPLQQKITSHSIVLTDSIQYWKLVVCSKEALKISTCFCSHSFGEHALIYSRTNIPGLFQSDALYLKS